MAEQIVLRAEFRDDLGKGATRRLRRLEDKVPGVLYGGGVDPLPLSIAYRDLSKAMQEEAFFAQILELAVGDKTQSCVLREVQRHPATEKVQHVDFLRIREDLPLQMNVPLHFLNEESCVGVKLGGGRIAHNLIEVEISCLPRDLPEYIEVDVGDLDVGSSVHLSDLTLPEGVTIVALGLGEDRDIPVVSVTTRRGGLLDEEEAAEEAEAETTDEAPEDDEDSAEEESD
ncbi:MAG: 50S ribosomal protein L25/general stress protein Ctc [Gammaproteobacteria bacterium]|nr:50S ribosomal protein L25/general stress protein Ctc [Gammaproteobacteria bacterium]